MNRASAQNNVSQKSVTPIQLFRGEVARTLVHFKIFD